MKNHCVEDDKKSNELLVINIITSPIGGGAELLVREAIKRLPKIGVQSRAIYFNTSPDIIFSDCEETISVSSRNPKAIFLLRRRIKYYCRNNHNVVVHSHLTWPFFYVAIAALFLPVKLVFTEHNTNNRRRQFPVFKYFERIFYNRYCKIFCISKGVSKSLSDWIGGQLTEKLIIIENGGRIYDFKPRERLSGRLPKLISIGSLSKKKGFETAMRVVAKVRNKIASYTIVGEGTERNRLEWLVQKLELEDKVKLIGWSDDVQTYLHQADLQLIPSVWEGFGLVAVEGMSTGLPVVASDVDGLRDIINVRNPSVDLVKNYENLDEWAEKIEAMIGLMEIKANVLAVASRKQSEKFSLDEMVAKYAEVYYAICH